MIVSHYSLIVEGMFLIILYTEYLECCEFCVRIDELQSTSQTQLLLLLGDLEIPRGKLIFDAFTLIWNVNLCMLIMLTVKMCDNE